MIDPGRGVRPRVLLVEDHLLPEGEAAAAVLRQPADAGPAVRGEVPVPGQPLRDRLVLVSGITVMAAMAGMYLGGAATFISFATGTIVVVAIAGDRLLTVLPALLSMLGDRVNKGRVPFLKPEKRTGEPRVWSWLLDRVLKRPLVSAIAATGVLVVLAIPVFHIHTADWGVDGLPRSIPIMQTYDRMQAAFPGEQFTADIVVEGKNLDPCADHRRGQGDAPDRA